MQILQLRLANAKASGLNRRLLNIQGIDLASNDYLGFATDVELQQRIYKGLENISAGASGSRLLRGNLECHEALEANLAKFVNRETALIFPSGYQANVALLSSLLHPEDLIFSDALNHASLIDGMRLTKAQKIIYPHCDLNFLEDALKKNSQPSGMKFIVTESLFSMDGTRVDLVSLTELAHRYHAALIVDEAHSTGLWGSSLVSTLGLTEGVFATIHPAGKALGAAGAWIAGGHLLKEYLVNFARPFIYSTAVLPQYTVQMQESINYFAEVGESRAKIVLQRAENLKNSLNTYVSECDGPILPIIIGDNFKTLQLSEKLQNLGWDVRAIRPPTVPNHTARLRITVKWNNSEEELDQFAETFRLLINES